MKPSRIERPNPLPDRQPIAVMHLETVSLFAYNDGDQCYTLRNDQGAVPDGLPPRMSLHALALAFCEATDDLPPSQPI